jgi:LacI family transcriptional regulator
MSKLRHAAGLGPVKQIMVSVDARGEFGRGVFHGVSRFAANRAGWQLYLDDDAGRSINWAHHRADGLIAGIADVQLLDRAAASCAGVVNTSAYVGPDRYPTILPDNLAIGRMAAEHFLERGFETFAFYGGPWNTYARLRYEGYSHRLGEAGKSCAHFPWIRQAAGRVDFDASGDFLGPWMQSLEKPAGLLASHDAEGFVLLRTAQRVGLSVPEQVAVVGVDNDQMRCPVANPPLSSVQPDFVRLGYEAGRLLERLLDGADPPTEPLLIPPIGVVTRQSSDIIAISDPELARAVQMIRHHACDPIGVEDLAGQVGTSRRTLERRFKQRLGRSPHQEILRVRLRRAEELLIRSEVKVGQIARDCGFGHVQNFNAAFAREFGQTPGAYRKAHRTM